jgi:hypothetical protein
MTNYSIRTLLALKDGNTCTSANHDMSFAYRAGRSQLLEE